MVDLVGNILFAVLLGWTVAATATDYLLGQSRPEEGGNMRVAHAERRPWGAYDPDLHSDFRGRVGLVLPVDSKAFERAPRQAGNKARSAFCAVPRDRNEGPMTWLRGHLSMFQRVAALEDRMDGMADWLDGKGM